MKTLLITLVMLFCGLALAKDPPKKAPHVYIVIAVYNKVSTDAKGTTLYAMMARDAKGDMIVVGISKEALQQLQQITEQTAISYGQ